MRPLQQIVAALILDADGKRIAAKYASPAPPSLGCDQQDLFELAGYSQVSKLGEIRSDVEPIVVKGFFGCSRSIHDVMVLVFCFPEENECTPMEICTALVGVLEKVCGGYQHLTKKALKENINCVYLLLDEVLDNSLVVETDVGTIHSRMTMESGEANSTTFNQALTSAKDSILRSFLS